MLLYNIKHLVIFLLEGFINPVKSKVFRPYGGNVFGYGGNVFGYGGNAFGLQWQHFRLTVATLSAYSGNAFGFIVAMLSVL